MISSAANVRLYPVMTHCSLGSVVWKSRRIVGIATLSTVVSSAAISTADRMMTSVIQRRGSGPWASRCGWGRSCGGLSVRSLYHTGNFGAGEIGWRASETTTAGAAAGPASGRRRSSLVETELAMLDPHARGDEPPVDAVPGPGPGELRARAHPGDRGAGEHQRPGRARRARRHDRHPSGRDDGDGGARAPQAAPDGSTGQPRRAHRARSSAHGRGPRTRARGGSASSSADWTDDDRATFGRLLGRLNEAIRTHPHVAEPCRRRRASGGDGGVRDPDAALGVGAVARQLLGEVERDRCGLRDSSAASSSSWIGTTHATSNSLPSGSCA